MSTVHPPKSIPTRIVGIDFGLARIGLSVSDENKIIAMTMATLACEKRSEDTVKKLVKALNDHASSNRYSIEEIVVGMPLLMNGKKGLLADEVLHFITLLKQHFSMPIVTWDERLSSVQADRSLREGSLSRKKRAKAVDSVAAIIILQNYLDSRPLKNVNSTD